MPKDPSTVYQGKKSLRLYNIEGVERMIKGYNREPMHPEHRKLLQRELGLIKAGRWDASIKDNELMAEFDKCINQTTTNGEKVCIPNERLDVIENVKDAISQLEIFFNETIPSNYENPGVMYEKIEEMIAFVQDMCKMVDFRQISDKKVHHRIYYEFDKVLSILQRFEKEIYFMATKLIPKEAFDFFHNQGITHIEAKGADGQVYRMNFSSHTYALKTALNKGVGMKKYMNRFLDLDHLNVLKFKYCLQTEENIDPRTSTGIPNAVMMEYCIESLANYINDHKRYISRYFYLAWAFGIVDGMEYLHYYHIIHRDLKPDK
uniref:Protein kinase domain-containing protein n=1 Tax=Acrobeloides nanus TaxID=290746 RepID=A0A914CI77_9BILA